MTGIELMSHAPQARLPVPLITPRLQLRPFEPGDVARFSELLSDQDTTRWIGGVKTETEALASVTRMRDSFQARGLGTLAVVPIGETQCAGYCGVRPLVHTQEMELAFGLLKAYWNRGIATEACIACLQAMFATFPLSSVVATVYPENLRSIAVLTKLGMKPESRVFGIWPNSFALLFRLTRESWLARDSAAS